MNKEVWDTYLAPLLAVIPDSGRDAVDEAHDITIIVILEVCVE